MGKKNKETAVEKRQLHEFQLLREFYPSMTPTPSLPTKHKEADNIIYIESFLADKISYEMKDVPAYPGSTKSKKWQDQISYATYELRRQLRKTGVTQLSILSRDVAHVRTHADAELHLRPFLKAADASPTPVVIGLDTEGEGATIQFGSRFDDNFRVVVLQVASRLRTPGKVTNVLAEGNPTPVKNYFCTGM